MLKNLIKLIAAAALVISFAACTETPSADAPTSKTAAAFSTLSSVFDVTGKTAADVSYIYDEDTSATATVPGYDMGDFLTLAAVNALVDPEETTIDYRSMFCYNIAGAAGYSFLNNNSQLDLATMLTGKYLYDSADADGKILVDGDRKDARNYFPSLDIIKGYDIKTARDIELYRAIKVSTTGVTSSNVITDSFATTELSWVKIKNDTEFANTNTAVAAESLLYEFFTANTGDKTTATYLVKCADYAADDDFTFEELTYEQLASAYFMPANETLAADGAYEDLLVVMNGTAADGTTPSNSSSSLRLKMPVEIVVTF